MRARKTTERKCSGGFNLVELLVAMVVLSIVVTMMASIFRDSQSASTQGTAQNEVETAGRVALSMMTHDLQTAVADSELTFNMQLDRTNGTSYGLTNSEVSFVAFQENPTQTNRVARMVMYWVQPVAGTAGRYELVRTCTPADSGQRNCYTNPSWFKDADEGGWGRPTSPDVVGVVAQNVAGLRMATSEPGLEYLSDLQGHRLPAYQDIYLEVLDERDARQAADLWARNLDYASFVERTARRFTTRVFFNNRSGYRGDKPR